MAFMKKHRVAHLGLGGRGKIYVKPYLDSDRFDLVGVCDLDRTKLDECASEHDLDSSIMFENLGEMLEKTKPDLFSFVTTPTVRLPIVEEGVKADPKGIIFEKPPANTLAELRKIRSVCDAAGIKAVVCHQHKYAPQFQKIKDYLASGDIGTIYEINLVCAIPRNITQVITHGLDVVLWLNGYSQPEWVAGHMNGAEDVEGVYPGAGYVVGRVKFKNGVYAFVESGADGAVYRNVGAKAEISVSVLGEKGSCFASMSGAWKIVDDTRGTIQGNEESILKTMHYDLQLPFNKEVAGWLAGGDEHTSCVKNAMLGQEILEGLYKSAETMKRISLPLPADDPGDRALRLKELLG